MDMSVGKELNKDMRMAEQLVRELDAYDIRYCHWKSNEHLKAGLEGRTDLDLLVDRADEETFIRILDHLCFRKAVSSPETTYPSVENWIGFCPKTGILLHLHVHYELVTGREFVKEYVLPWSQYMLDHATRDKDSGFMIADPHIEIIILLLRISIKTKYSVWLMTQLMRRASYANAVQKELDYLHERVEPEVLEETFNRMLPEESMLKASLRGMLTQRKLEGRSLLRVKREARKAFQDSIRYGKVETVLKSMRGRLKQKWNLVRERMGMIVLRRKQFESGGSVIALVGLEDEDREKLLRNLEKWLKWKMETRRFPIAGAKKEKLVTKIQQLREEGSIVLLEMGEDNPELMENSSVRKNVSGTRFTLHLVPDARLKEEALQKVILEFSPDLVIRIKALERPVQTGTKLAPLKDAAVEDELFQIAERRGQDQKVFEVDANLPLEKLILNTRRLIWQHL